MQKRTCFDADLRLRGGALTSYHKASAHVAYAFKSPGPERSRREPLFHVLYWGRNSTVLDSEPAKSCAGVTDCRTLDRVASGEMTFDRTFFITTVTWQRTPLFRNLQRVEVMMDVLEHYRGQKKYVLHEFVIMPDHLHLLITPATEISLERAMQLIKGGFSYRMGRSSPSVAKRFLWQESFTNHRIRDEQDYAQHAEYIRTNPVRARLAERPELYPYSSASARFPNAIIATI